MRELLYHAVYDYQDGITEGANLSLVADDFIDKLIESEELKTCINCSFTNRKGAFVGITI